MYLANDIGQWCIVLHDQDSEEKSPEQISVLRFLLGPQDKALVQIIPVSLDAFVRIGQSGVETQDLSDGQVKIFSGDGRRIWRSRG
jgi:hypothetical protein